MVIHDGERAIVVDTTTGHGSILQDVISFLRPMDVIAIVLTHIHIDHSGGAAYLADELSAPVYIHEAELGALRNGDPHLSVASLWPMEFTPVKDARALPESIKLGDGRIAVIHTPGHTPGSVILYIPEDRVLISGDTVFASHGVGRWDLPGGSLRKLKKSIKRIMELDFDIFYPGHGPPGTKSGDLPPFL